MGKRSKNNAVNSGIRESKVSKKSKETEESVSVNENIGMSKKRRTKNKSMDNIKKYKVVAEDVLEVTSTNIEHEPNIAKSKRAVKSVKSKSDINKKIIFEEDTGKTVKVSKSKQVDDSEKKKSDKNKKIIFEEDTGEPIEVSTSGTYKNDIVSEEQVKDEDIDNFCNDITEEDNVQYENWVQLIEAKLKSNKSKTKT